MISSGNYFLDTLTPADREQLGPHLKPVKLEKKTILFDQGDYVSKVYFPTTAIISLVMGLSTGQAVQGSMAGRDGVVAAASALDGKISLYRAVVQLSGASLICDAQRFKEIAIVHPTMISSIMHHEQTQYGQSQQSTACMAAHDVERRLCRWLLRSRDLAGSDVLLFTQEFLAEMLGVRRTSVTEVAIDLQERGFIRYTRGNVEILDVEGLRKTTCECYAAVRAQYGLLVGEDATMSMARGTLEKQSDFAR